jgi:hypothetical protein
MQELLKGKYNNGEMRAMWQDDNLWSKPQPFDEIHQAHFQAQSAKDKASGEWATGTKNDVH